MSQLGAQRYKYRQLKKPYNPEWRGGGVLIHYKDSFGKVYVLVGYETKYLFDYFPKLKELEYIFKICTLEQAMIEYGRIARNMSLMNLFDDEPKRVLVTFDMPIWKGNHWRAHFRIKPRTHESVLGILKGGYEFEDRSPLDTAIREVVDITGMKPHESQLCHIFKDRGFHYFSHEISESDAEKYKNSISVTQFTHLGKMQYLEFTELSELLLDRTRLNTPTANILTNYFGTHQ